MRIPRLWPGLLGTLALAALPGPAGAQPVGSEFQVNTYTTSDQRTIPRGGHLAAADASGNFVVVWNSSGQDGGGFGIFAQRYDSEGVPLGGEFRVNSFTSNSQKYASVARAADGDFVVVWSSNGQDGSGYGIFGRRYDSGGTAQGSEFRVNSFTAGNQRWPSVATTADGDFVVVWTSAGQDGSSDGIFGQRYDSEGAARGGEFRVNTSTGGSQQVPSIASDASGNFVVVWGHPFGTYYLDVLGQRYDNEGVARGNEFLIDHAFGLFGPPVDHSVASDAIGNFVVAWSNTYALIGQRYDSEGVKRGVQFTIGSGINTSVASDASGNFVAVWEGLGGGSGFDVFGRRYDSDGMARGGPFRLNAFTTGSQERASVGAVGDDTFVAVWESGGQDGSGRGVFGQQLDFGEADTVTVVSPNTNAKWRVGSLHEIRWTHNIGGDATFRIKLDRNGDGEYEELIAAAAPADSDTTGSLAWTVTGPASKKVRVRIAWTDDPAVSDSSVTFQIKPAEP
jgi:hypothetical protein